jgi:membrane associated rhomboid family serine protease
MPVFLVGSEQPVSRPALANLTIIAMNVVVFGLEILYGDPFVLRWSFHPADLAAFFGGTGSFHSVLTVFTSMFMHAGLMHLLGNMVFLWVFGQAVEDRFGSRHYVTFYLACGIAANFAQFIMGPDSTVPNLGASGAIAGVMGSYLAMFPGSRVAVYAWPLSFFMGRNLHVPAWIVLGVWFALQVTSVQTGVTAAPGSEGGVAYYAHIGGFAAGFLLARIVRPGR